VKKRTGTMLLRLTKGQFVGGIEIDNKTKTVVNWAPAFKRYAHLTLQEVERKAVYEGTRIEFLKG
jgi:hypothetical protein